MRTILVHFVAVSVLFLSACAGPGPRKVVAPDLDAAAVAADRLASKEVLVEQYLKTHP